MKVGAVFIIAKLVRARTGQSGQLRPAHAKWKPERKLDGRQEAELVHSPKHGLWLNTAEYDLSVLTRQCLGGRIPELSIIQSVSAAWSKRRNDSQTGLDWQFRTDDAGAKLKRLYPKIIE